MEIALEEIIVEGIKTTVPFHLLALRHPDFRRGDVDTRFVEKLFKARAGAEAPPPAEPAPRPRKRRPATAPAS